MNKGRKRLRPGPDVPDRPTPAAADQPSTTEQLRADIDSGRTRDKVAFPDPAAAPLGTDAEAGGAQVPPETVAAERRESLESPSQERPRRGPSVLPWGVALIAAAVLLGLIAVWISS